MESCFCVVICRRLLHCSLCFTLDVYETLLALTLHMCVFLKFCLIFSFHNSTVPCTAEFTGHMLSDEMLVEVAGTGNNQWEWK